MTTEQINEELRRYEQATGIQIRYVPKVHLPVYEPTQVKPSEPQRTIYQAPSTRAYSERVTEWNSEPCPLPDTVFHRGYCPSPCSVTPCPRRLGPFDPGPHNYGGPGNPRGSLGPDPRGPDPRGPR